MQHLIGVGHQRRSAAIARALASRGLAVSYVSGGLPLADLDLQGCRFYQLPPARSLDMRYHTLVDAHGRAVDARWREARCERLLALFDQVDPAVLITETWPFGRGLLRFELEPLLERARSPHRATWCVSSMRDIVERRKDPSKYRKMADRVLRGFDRVLVHSDPTLVPFEDSFPLTDEIRDRLRYTGYVGEQPPRRCVPGSRDGPVVVSAGGGFFGEHVLRAAIAARALSRLRDRPWRVLVGPNLAEPRFAALRAEAGPGITVERNRADFQQLLASCSVSVSQGGYNTVLDVLHARIPAVIVPFEDEREREQVVRARHLAARGLVHLLENAALTPRRLAEAVDAAAADPRPPRVAVDMSGAEVSARIVHDLLALAPQRAAGASGPGGGDG